MTHVRSRWPRRTQRLSILALCVAATVGLTTAASAETAKLPTITYQYGSPGGVPRDLSDVNKAMNARLARLGFQVKLRPIDYGSYDQKMKLQFAAHQRCDVVWTSYFNNDFNQRAAAGDYAPLEKLLPKYAPGLLRDTPKSAWRASTVKRHIYATFNQQSWVYPYGPIFRKSAIARFGIDLKTFKKWSDLSKLTPIMARMAAQGLAPTIFSPTFPFDSVAGLDTLVGSGGIAAVRYNDDKLRVVNPITVPEYRAAVQLARNWRDATYYPTDDKPFDILSTEAKAGQYQVLIDQHNYDSQFTSYYGGVWKGLAIAPLFLTTNGIQTTMSAVCKTSKYPAESVKFIEAVNTDTALYRLLGHGIQSKHWRWVNKKKNLIGYPSGVTATTSGYNPNTDWMFGNTFKAPYVSPADIGVNKVIKRWNAKSPPSVALGFVLDPTSIQTELAQLGAVVGQCQAPLALGHVDPAKGIPDCVNAMNDAGEQKVLAEVQRQLRAWKKRTG